MILLTLSALFILWVKNPMHAVLGLILVFINSAILLLSLHIDFVAIIYVVVYVGAISVLFLFVIMLLNLRSAELANRTSLKYELIPYIFSYIIFFITYIYFTVAKINYEIINFIVGEQVSNNSLTSFVTSYLFDNPMHLILLTILLLLAIISPITIASKQHTHSKKQDLFSAITRDLNTIKLINL
jgi:NADH-quinone oxidoreductase subunit J